MNDNRKQFLKFFWINTIVMLLMFALHLLSIVLFPSGPISRMTPYSILFFSIFNLLFFYIKRWLYQSKDSKFINLFLIFNSVKMVLFIAIIAVYAYFFHDDAINFAIGFFICYAVFTTVLVRSFNRLQKVR
ncbi:MAG: hypothetical protein BWX63_00038 [Bacteroidetes bacterium ADurb.Bin041]|nr:MAG: hypothetical protein BWX63_00038 [Bacteroidetes bacterium ADurb.Bin041]